MFHQDLSPLYRALGHDFTHPDYLTQALTHRSFSRNHYERLEYLGDSILGFVIADKLYQQFPNEPEGVLSQLRMFLVKGKTLTDLATEFDVGSYLILGPGEIKAGGHKRTRILEDVIEAIIGAIYLDAGLEKARSCILQWFEPRLQSLSLDRHTKDAKSKLQERLLQNGHPRPDYELVSIEGSDHEQIFTIVVHIPVFDIHIQAQDRTRKSAEQKGAQQAIALLDQKDLCHGTQKKRK